MPIMQPDDLIKAFKQVAAEQQNPVQAPVDVGPVDNGVTESATQIGFTLNNLAGTQTNGGVTPLAPSNDGSGNKAAVLLTASLPEKPKDEWYTNPATWYQAVAKTKWDHDNGYTSDNDALSIMTGLMKMRNNPEFPQFMDPFSVGNQTKAEEYLRGVQYNGAPLLGANEQMTPEWVQSHMFLLDYLKLSDAGNPLGPTTNDAKNGRNPLSNAAYYFNSMLTNGSFDNDAKNAAEWAALQEDVAYWVGRKDLNLTDEQIIEKLNLQKNYPNLYKLSTNRDYVLAGGSSNKVMNMARGTEFSNEAIHGLIWASRNGGYEKGSMTDWMYGYYARTGNQYVEDPRITSRLTWGSEDYNPYAVCATLEDELQYFGVSQFDRYWCVQHPEYANGTEEQKKHFDAVWNAEQFTQKAETQYATLQEKVDGWIARGLDAKDIQNKIDTELLSGNYDALVRIEKSLEASDRGLISTTRPIAYSRHDLFAYVDDKCATRAEADANGILDVSDVAKTLADIQIPLGPPDEVMNNVRQSVLTVLGENGTDVERTTAALADENFDNSAVALAKTLEAERINAENDALMSDVCTSIYMKANPNFLEKTAPVAQYRAWETKKANRIQQLEDEWGITYVEGENLKLEDTKWSQMSNEEKLAFAMRLFDVEPVENEEDTYRVYSTNPDGSKKQQGAFWGADDLINAVEEADWRGGTFNGIPLNSIITLLSGDLLPMEGEDAQKVFGLVADIYDCDYHMADLHFSKEDEAMYEEGKRLMEQSADAHAKVALGPNSNGTVGHLWYDAMDMMYGLYTYDATTWLPYDDFTYYIEQGVDNAERNGTYTENTRPELEAKAVEYADLTVTMYTDTMEQMRQMMMFLEASDVQIPEQMRKNYERELARMQRSIDQANYFLLGQREDFEEKADKFSWIDREISKAENPYINCLLHLNDFIPNSDNPMAVVSDKDMVAVLESDRTDKDGYTALDYLVMTSAYITGDLKEWKDFLRPFGVTNTSRYFNLELLTEDERKRYFYLRETEGFEAAKKYINTLIDPTYGTLVTRSALVGQNKTKEIASSGFWGAAGTTIGSFATSQMQKMGLLYMAAQSIKGEEINPYSPWFNASRFTTTSRNTVWQSIVGKGDNVWRNLAGRGYNAVTSAVDSYFSWKLGGAFLPWVGKLSGVAGKMAPGFGKWAVEAMSNFGGALWMAADAAGTAGMNTKLNRGSDDQAWQMALSTGFWESITEAIEMNIFKHGKYEFDDFFRKGGWKTAAGWKGMAYESYWAYLTEFSGEFLNHVGESADEFRIMGDKSAMWAARDLATRKYGMSKDIATSYMYADVMKEAFEEGRTGGLSGLLMFFGSAGSTSAQNAIMDRATGGQSVVDRISADLSVDNAVMENLIDRLNRHENRIGNRNAKNNGTSNAFSDAANAYDINRAEKTRGQIAELQAEIDKKRSDMIGTVAAMNGIDVEGAEASIHQNELLQAFVSANMAADAYKAQPTERNRMRSIEANDALTRSKQELREWVDEHGPLDNASAVAIYERTGEWYGDPNVPEAERTSVKPEEAPTAPEEAEPEAPQPVVGVTPNGVEAHSMDELLNALAEEKGEALDRLNTNRDQMTDDEYLAALRQLDFKYNVDRAARTGMTPDGQVLTGDQLSEALHGELDQALKALEESMHGKGPHMSYKQYQRMREKLMRRYGEENAYLRYDARTAEEAQLAEEEARRAAQIEAEAAREAADQAQPEEETAQKEPPLMDSRGNEIPANALGVTPGGQYANTAAKLYTLLRAEKEQSLALLDHMEKNGTISKGFANAMREKYETLYSYENARARLQFNRTVAESQRQGEDTEAAPEKHGPYFFDPNDGNTYKPEFYRYGLVAALTDLDALQVQNQRMAMQSTAALIDMSLAMRRMDINARGMDINAYKDMTNLVAGLFNASMNSNRMLNQTDAVMALAMDVMHNGAENAPRSMLNQLINEMTGLRDTYVDAMVKQGLFTEEDVKTLTLTEAMKLGEEAKAKMAEEAAKAQQAPAPETPRDENGFDMSDQVISQQGNAESTPAEAAPATQQGEAESTPAEEPVTSQQGEAESTPAEAAPETTEQGAAESTPETPEQKTGEEVPQNPPAPEQREGNEIPEMPQPEAESTPQNPPPEEEQDDRLQADIEIAPEGEPRTTTDVGEAPQAEPKVIQDEWVARARLLLDAIAASGKSTQAAGLDAVLADPSRGELDAEMAAAAAMKLAALYNDPKAAADVVHGAISVGSNRSNVQLAFQIAALTPGGLSAQALQALSPTPTTTQVDNLVRAAYQDSKAPNYRTAIGDALRDYNVARELQQVVQQDKTLRDSVNAAQEAYNAAVNRENDDRQAYEQMNSVVQQLGAQVKAAGIQVGSDSKGTVGKANAGVVGALADTLAHRALQLPALERAYKNSTAARQYAGNALKAATENAYARAKQAAETGVINRTAERAQQALNDRNAKAQAAAETVRQAEEAQRRAENERDGQNLDEADWNEFAREKGYDVNDEARKQKFLERAKANREANNATRGETQTAPGEMTEAKKKLVENIARSYGLQLKWDANILGGRANGAFDGKTIYLSPNIKSDQALQHIFFHELTHSAEGARYYRNLIAMAIDLGFNGDYKRFNRAVDRRLEAYNNYLRQNGQSIDRTKAQCEVVADVLPSILFASEEQANEFAERRPTTIGYLIQSVKEFIAKLRGVETEAKARLMRAQLTYENALRKAERARQRRMDQSAHPLSELFHIETLLEASDLIPVRDENGDVLYLADLNGNRVEKITADNMENTPMGRLTRNAVKLGTLTEEGRDHIMDTMAALATLVMKVNDVGSVWEITGAFFTSPTQTLPWEWTGDPTFSAVKSNSDPQYSSTIDFGTVCARTQQLIDVLSQTMVAEGRGLTRNEVLRAYQMVATEHVTEEYAKAHPEMRDENGNPKRLQITCPVCYVFSRWIGVPSLLNTIGQYQRQFLNMTDQELTDWVNNTQNRFLDENGVFNKDKLDAEKTKLKNKLNKLLENVDNYMREHRMSENLESDPEFNDLMDRMEKAQADFDALNAYAYVTQVALEWARNGNETYLVAYDQNGKRVSKPGPNTLYHRDRSVNIVPNEILFDMNRGGDFARLYPKTWSFRTTRGAGMGKAVMPFGGWRIGDVVYGAQTGGARVGATRTRVNPLTGQAEQVLLSDKKDNYFLRNANGKYVYENRMRDALKNASRRQRAQNLIGGQRLQSTSDFRAEWGLDYVLAMMELQALHSKTQMYTKVLDAIPFLASMGNEVNMSAMSNGLGYRTNADGSQELALSSITGVDPTMGYRFQHMYDNAQMILVGLNDTHIRLALQNSEDLNNDIMFVIPWHSSGNSIAMLDMMMNAIGADGASAHQDYTVYENDEDVQGFIDKALKGEYKAYAENGGTMTRGQYYADRLGKLGFTEFGFNVKGTVEEGGLDRLAELVDSKADFKVVPTALQQARRDARYKIVNGTYMAKGKDRKPFTAADMAAIESSAYLQRLYDRFCVDKNSDAYQVSFASATAEKIFPHEYWDKSADYWHARVNGDNFVEYCREMGLVPRFSQFTDEDGYWKLLIDRRMFDRQGNYREAGYVDVTEAATRLLPMTVNDATYGDTEATARAVEHVRFGRENADGTFTPSAVADWNTVLARMNATETDINNDGLVFSLPVEDQETLDFLENQEHITVYRSMNLYNGELLSPKAAVIGGKRAQGDRVGQWVKAQEDPSAIKRYNKNGVGYLDISSGISEAGKANKGVTVHDVAYNPYIHTSNSVFNDQFTGAYKVPTLVVVECVVPVSEADGAYKAEHAKDATGWLKWHSGTTSAQLKGETGFARQLFLSRYAKAVRILSNAEVAQRYADMLRGTDVAVADNVVSPGLLLELMKTDVKIEKSGKVEYDADGNPILSDWSRQTLAALDGNIAAANNGMEYSLDLEEARDNLQAMLDPEQANLEDVSTDTGDVIDDAEFHIGTGEEQYVRNGTVNDEVFEDELMDSWIQNPESRQAMPSRQSELAERAGTDTRRAAAYNRRANPLEPNNNQDHAQRMKSPQQIAKGLARKLNIGQAIGTRNMSGVPAQVLGFYEQRVRAIRVRNMNANSFVVGMHELGHGVAAQIGMQGTPEMIARLPALFAQNYSAAQLPGEAFAEFFWQYMTQENKAVPFAGQDFVDQVEQAMKDHGIYDAVQASRGEMLLWMNGSTMDRIRSVTRNRSDGVGKGIRDMMRTIVDSAVDSTYAAERVNAMIREQTKQKTLPFAEDLRKNALMRNFASRQAFNLLANNLTDADGTIIGDSLGARFLDAGFVATDQNIDMLISYMLAQHSLDRDAQHKPVFDEYITPQARQDFINRVQNEHPEIAAAEQAFQRFRNEFLKAWMVDTGFLSQDALDQFNTMYPHYVPTLRVKDARYHSQNQQGGRSYTIRRAVGSTEDIWNPLDSFVGMINSVVGMVATNRTGLVFEHAYRTYDGMGIFGQEITPDVEMTQVDLTELSKKIENILETEVDDDVLQDVLDLMQDGFTSVRRTNRTTMPNGIMVQHADGTRSFFEIFDTELYKLLAGVQENTKNIAWETIGKLTHTMAGLTTGANPIFAARNFMRDFQTSVDYGSWASNYITGFGKWVRAFYEVWTKGGEWADYEALGGGGWTRIQADTRKGADEYRQAVFQKGYNTRNLGATARFLGQKLWNTLTLARLNEVVEQTSRYAEYRFGQHDKSTPEGRMDAFLAAQDATVDFARKGNASIAQTLKQLIPFFGASVQGVNRTMRQFSEGERERSFTRFAKTVVNTALMSALASLAMLKFMDDDEKKEFVQMSDSLKATHFYLPNFAPDILGEAPLIRVPVGQDPLMYAVHGLVTDMMWTGTGDKAAIDVAAVANAILDNLNPTGNGTIFEAAFGVMRNETYYGGTIVPASVEKQAAGNQYSDSTPDFFIGMGRLLGVSPNIVQYLAEQYTGFLGQLAVPALSKTEGGHLGGMDAVIDSIRRKFTSDPLSSNNVLNDFYDGRDRLNEVKAAGDSGRPMIMLRRGLDEDDAKDAYDEAVSMLSSKGIVGSTAKQITAYYSQIDEVNADPTLTPHEKAIKIRDIRREMISTVLDAQQAIGEFDAKYWLGYNPILDWLVPAVTIEK